MVLRHKPNILCKGVLCHFSTPLFSYACIEGFVSQQNGGALWGRARFAARFLFLYANFQSMEDFPMKRVVFGLLSLLLLALSLASCNTECEHTWDFGSVTVAPKCTLDGEITYKCTKCEVTRDEILLATGHTELVTDAAVPATCDEPGLTEGSHCGTCGVTVVSQSLIPAAHTVEVLEAVLPTCTATGLTEGKTCTACGDAILEQEVLDPIDHAFGDGRVCLMCESDDYHTKGLVFRKYGNNGYYVSIGTATDTEIVVPSFYKTLPVIGVDSDGFKDCTAMTSIVLPEGIKSIGSGAFVNCSSLESITIPDAVDRISHGTFSGCTSLESITLPWFNVSSSDSISTVYECPTTDSYTHFGLIFGNTKYRDQNSVVPESLKSVTITIGTLIDSYAFYGCENLESITVSDKIEYVGENAFEGCSALRYNKVDGGYYLGSSETPYKVLVKIDDATSFEAHEDTAIIAGEAFFNHDELLSVTLPEGLKSVGIRAFYYCTSLTEIVIPESVTIVAPHSFAECSSLESLTLPAPYRMVDVFAGRFVWGTSWGDPTYYDTADYVPESLKRVVFTGGTEIDVGSFFGIYNIKEIILPDTLTYVYDNAFTGCSLNYNEYGAGKYLGSETNPYLVLIDVDDTVTEYTVHADTVIIDDNAFRECKLLESVQLGTRLKSIGDGVFVNCEALKRIEIPEGVTSIGNCVFSMCESLVEAILPDSIKSIGSAMFEYCTALVEIRLPANLERIREYTFWNCSSLTSITIPDTVVLIGNTAFAGCSKLTAIVLPKGLTAIEGSAFLGCTSLSSVTSYSPLRVIGESAFKNCTSLSSIYIASSDMNILDNAFSGCSALTNVYYRHHGYWWSKINISSVGNDALLSATKTFEYSYN